MSSRFPPPNNKPPSSFGQRPNPPTQQSPFGQRPNPPLPNSNSLLQRMGSKVTWTLLPVVDEIACFDLRVPVPDALREIGIPVGLDTLVDLLHMVKEKHADAQTLRELLDQSWQSYGLHGAALVYQWRDDLREGMAARLTALKQPPIYLRVTDPLLVLNVLARARTSLLLANAPLALEFPYLSRVLASDDSRLLELARAKGSTREPLVAPEALPEDDSE
jgi:hypothetical protein